MYGLEEKLYIILAEEEVTPKRVNALEEVYGDLSVAAMAIPTDERAKKILGEHYAAVSNALVTGRVERSIEKMYRNDVTAITRFSPLYPDVLHDLEEPPYILFCRGDIGLLNSRCISVIGTRKVSAYGRRIVGDFVRELSKHFTVVSGLAMGADAVAHEATLNEGGKTIAVLGSSVIDVYPSSNQQLAERIVQNRGLLISEYGVNSTPLSFHFLHRNRLVAGLSDGVLVCQAPLKSGTLSTVGLALDQGRDVFVVPGEIYDSGFFGSNRLIKGNRGICVTTPKDICEHYRIGVVSQEQRRIQLNFEEQAVVDALTDGQLSFDALVEKTKIRPSDLNFLLANLELKSIIAKLPGNIYRLFGGIE